MGCSFTRGLGVAPEQAWPNQLSLLLDQPTANLGIDGASIGRIWLTYLALRAKYKPKLTIFSWNGLDRDHFVSNDKIVNLGPWSLDTQSYPAHVKDYKQKLLDGSLRQANKQICELARKEPNSLNFIFMNMFEQGKFMDLGTDNSHPGAVSHKHVAEQLYLLIDPAVKS
jgi:hypothetical protein